MRSPLDTCTVIQVLTPTLTPTLPSLPRSPTPPHHVVCARAARMATGAGQPSRTPSPAYGTGRSIVPPRTGDVVVQSCTHAFIALPCSSMVASCPAFMPTVLTPIPSSLYTSIVLHRSNHVDHLIVLQLRLDVAMDATLLNATATNDDLLYRLGMAVYASLCSQ